MTDGVCLYAPATVVVPTSFMMLKYAFKNKGNVEDKND